MLEEATISELYYRIAAGEVLEVFYYDENFKRHLISKILTSGYTADIYETFVWYNELEDMSYLMDVWIDHINMKDTLLYKPMELTF